MASGSQQRLQAWHHHLRAGGGDYGKSAPSKGQIRLKSARWLFEIEQKDQEPCPHFGRYRGGSSQMAPSGKESACQYRRCRGQGSIPGLGRSLEEEMAAHSNVLAWKIRWTEEPGGLQSMGSLRVRHSEHTWLRGGPRIFRATSCLQSSSNQTLSGRWR